MDKNVSDILTRVRKIELKTRRLSDDLFGGAYHSSFKGRGMTFSEVRKYEYGDDVRTIDLELLAKDSAGDAKNLLALSCNLVVPSWVQEDIIVKLSFDCF
jgi:hypothetical protein